MNMESSFIHLHNHSEFSILDGALKTAALVEAAYQNKMPAVALTDHGNIFQEPLSAPRQELLGGLLLQASHR